MIYLNDGRPIDEKAIDAALKSIDKEGVHGHHLLLLMEIFSATELECQVALNIAFVKWRNMKNRSGMINDAGVALLIVIYLKHPNRWPIKYIGDPDLEKLEEHLTKPMVPMLVGRSKHSMYRWQPTEKPKDHIKVLLSYLLSCIESDDQDLLEEYREIVNKEAERRGINILRDSSWSHKDDTE